MATYDSDRECLAALDEFLTYEQKVTPQMTEAYEESNDVALLKLYIEALATQVGDAWRTVNDYLASAEPCDSYDVGDFCVLTKGHKANHRGRYHNGAHTWSSAS